jgi:hypothetical protein
MVDFNRDVYGLFGRPFDSLSMPQAVDRSGSRKNRNCSAAIFLRMPRQQTAETTANTSC